MKVDDRPCGRWCAKSGVTSCGRKTDQKGGWRYVGICHWCTFLRNKIKLKLGTCVHKTVQLKEQKGKLGVGGDTCKTCS